MKRISQMLNLPAANDVFNAMKESSPLEFDDLTDAIKALDGIADQMFENCGDSPEAIRGAVVMMASLMELLQQRPDDQSVEVDSFLLTFGMPFLFAKLSTRPEIREASELLDRIS